MILNFIYRNTLLKSIKETAEKDISQFKAAKEKEYQAEYAKVNIFLINNEGSWHIKLKMKVQVKLDPKKRKWTRSREIIKRTKNKSLIY